jgi:hypothetical protein
VSLFVSFVENPTKLSGDCLVAEGDPREPSLEIRASVSNMPDASELRGRIHSGLGETLRQAPDFAGVAWNHLHRESLYRWLISA